MKTWKYELTIPPTYDQKTVRKYLENYLLLPKHLVFSLRKANRILINGNYLPMNFSVHPGDQVTLCFIPSDFHEPFPNVTPNNELPIHPVFENNDFLIINKPAGIKTHANQPNEKDALLNFAAGYLQPQDLLPYMVHRIDQQTSGLIIFGKNPAVVPVLTNMVRNKTIKRTYIAWVRGRFSNQAGIINKPIGFDSSDKRKRKINGVGAKKAVTTYRCLTESGNNTLLEISLLTGRTHQIRVHLQSLNHPILNDPLYDEQADKECHMLLHSSQIKMHTPYFFKPLTVTSKLPEYFQP